MSGAVFHNISEGEMAKSLKLRVEDARDSLSVFIPDVKGGNVNAKFVLEQLGIHTGEMKFETTKSVPHQMPNTIGMGARDAVYAVERQGIKARVKGKGRVVRQSIAPGSRLKDGMICTLELN